jgi:putative transposase
MSAPARPQKITFRRNALRCACRAICIATVRKALRQAWEIDDAARAEQLMKNLARRLEREAAGVAASILEGLEEVLMVTRLGLPQQLRRSIACTNIIENMNGTIGRVYGNVKRWRHASVALRWTAAAMIEAAKGFRALAETEPPRGPCCYKTH